MTFAHALQLCCLVFALTVIGMPLLQAGLAGRRRPMVKRRHRRAPIEIGFTMCRPSASGEYVEPSTELRRHMR